MENPNETTIENGNPPVKTRHGCVTAWLIFMIIGNSAVALIYLFAQGFITRYQPDISSGMLILLAIGGIANVAFAVLLFQWKKWAFWGFIISAVYALIINLSIGLGIGQCMLGLIGIAVLYGILQIKQDNVSAWDNLE
jgi:hypothetical protein